MAKCEASCQTSKQTAILALIWLDLADDKSRVHLEHFEGCGHPNTKRLTLLPISQESLVIQQMFDKLKRVTEVCTVQHEARKAEGTDAILVAFFDSGQMALR